MTPDQKLDAFESLLNELSGGLADVVEAMKEKSEAGAMEEISATLVDMKEIIEAATKSKSYDGMVAAIKAIRIQSTVNVSPTPITVEAVLPPSPAPIVHFLPDPSAKGATWEVTVPGRYGEGNRTMIIKRTN